MSADTSSAGVYYDRFGQPHCGDCRLTMRHERRDNAITRTNHHNSVYVCPRCGSTHLSG